MKTHFRKYLLAISLCTLTFISCSKSDTENEIFTPRSYNVTGKVEKGPFVSGSTITIQPMDSKLEALGSMYNTTITDNLGNFTFGTKEFQAPYAEMMATGYFFNEIKGYLSDGVLVLRALVDLSDNSTVNVNILTHLKYPRIKHLIESGKTFSEANTQAQKELLKEFGLQKYATKDVSKFSITEGTDESIALLAVSSLLLYERSEGVLTEYLSSLSQDFGTNGHFSEAVKAQFREDRLHLVHELDNIQENVIRRYTELGLEINIKNLISFFDWDEDGIAGNELGKPIISVDKTEIRVPKEGGVFMVKINSPIPVYTEMPGIEISYPSTGQKDISLYDQTDNNKLFVEKSIESNVLTIEVGRSLSRKEQTILIDLYDSLGTTVATITLNIEANISAKIPRLSNEGKSMIKAFESSLFGAYSTYNILEQHYYNNKKDKRIPLSSENDYISNSWGLFFNANYKLLFFKELDDKRLSIYQDYCNIFYSMYYFTMIVAWGDIPYNYGNYWDISNYNTPRLPKDEVLIDLKLRLKNALDNLEEKRNQPFEDINSLFFVSKDVARIQLANIHMYEGDWDLAKSLLTEVINNGYYTLDQEYEYKTTSKDIIFALTQEILTEGASHKNSTIKVPNILPIQTMTDVYLSMAECEYNTGNKLEANKLLSMVATAKGIKVSSEGIIGVKEVREQLLLHSTSYFSFLKRNNIAQSECGILDYQLLFPIPIKELYTNSQMSQNLGY